MKSFLAASTAMLCLAPSAYAQDGEGRRDEQRDETSVVTGTKNADFGTKSDIPLDRIPQGIQVFDEEELIGRGARSVGDALRAVPSANVGGSRVSRYQSFGLKVRGFVADQMRNGIRQRYYEDVDASALSNIARIEVLKGPSAMLYGVGGILSIVTSAVVLDDYTLFDLGLETAIGPVRIDAALTDVADKTYYSANGGANFVYPGDPRTLSVRVGYAPGGRR